MRKVLFPWHGRVFVMLSSEANRGPGATEEMRELLGLFAEELKPLALSLDNTVRTRLWGRDSESRSLAHAERLKILSGRARYASSSYSSPSHFCSDARVAMDLLAMRDSGQDGQKIIKEYEPPIAPPRYVKWGPFVFVSGVATPLPNLQEQVHRIIPWITESMVDAGVSWEKAILASFYLHRSQRLEQLQDLFKQQVQVQLPRIEYEFVDGYANEGQLVEIEVTALQ